MGKRISGTIQSSFRKLKIRRQNLALERHFSAIYVEEIFS